jgi:NarL family two-component system response regulator YdfI
VSARRVLVVASSPVVRAGLESLLARTGEYAVLGAAALPRLRGDALTEPDVIVLALRGGGEEELARDLAPEASTGPAVVVLGAEPVADWGPRVLRLGARAVLPETAGAAELAAAIEAAAAGLVALPPELVGVAARAQLRSETAVAPQPLTAREVEVLGLLAAGLGNKVIAGRLAISEHTVKSHVTSLFAKLAVSTRAEAVAAGVRQGLLML